MNEELDQVAEAKEPEVKVVEKVVEKIVEVPVEKIVEKVVEKIVEVEKPGKGIEFTKNELKGLLTYLHTTQRPDALSARKKIEDALAAM